MKRFIKYSWLFNVLLICSYFLSLYSPVIIISSADFSNDNPGSQESKIILLSSDLSGTAVESKTISVFTGIALSFQKNYLGKFSPIPGVAELLHEINISRSIFYTINSVIQFHQTDIIFPFHYFW